MFESWNKPGIKVPMAHDSTTDQPSVTLLIMYASNLLAILSLIYLHIKGDAFVATSATCIYAVICTVLYMMRKLQHAKFDLKDESFSLDSGDDNQKQS